MVGGRDSVNIEIVEGALIIELMADLVANVVRNNLENAREKIDSGDSFDSVILDISNIENIDSVGITFIVGLYKTSLENNKDFKVIGANENIANLFKLMSLDEVFPIE